jgi:hypothetical protein
MEKETDTTMKSALIFILTASSYAFAQDKANVVYQTAGSVSAVGWGAFDKSFGTPVQGAPYSATITNESIQPLADGNRIVQTSSGTTARDSQGRTRQDTVLPAIGNLSAANAPHLVFIQDPAAQTSYTLNLTDKTAQKMPAFPALAGGPMGVSGGVVNMKFVEANGPSLSTAADTLPSPIAVPAPGMVIQKRFMTNEQMSASTEDLGSQTMEGVLVNGVRSTSTIPAGQIGNDRPITIVTEVWTSSDLKTVVYSKRSDPRMGEQTFQLTNIVRAEPDPSLFTVPGDFKIIDGPQPIIYRPKQ